jgi:NAD(P)-dependent dehydrogenase (short-subunit alcohol dehydrogenase family)
VNPRLAGAHALVTGAGTGIGAAVATALAAEGARLTLLGRHRDALELHAATLPSSAAALVVLADVVDDAAVATAFAAARERHGEIDILVNNAGASISKPFAALDRATWDAMLAVNLTGTYVCCHAAIPAMVEAGHGRVINMASTAGLVGGPYIAAYSAAKHGVVGLTRSLAAEFGKRGVTINAVCPGFTETPMLERTLDRIERTTGRTEQQAAQALLSRNPLGRFVRPQEVASVVVWLSSPDSVAINGQAIVVDGGEVAR